MKEELVYLRLIVISSNKNSEMNSANFSESLLMSLDPLSEGRS
jgi:hypothetical protein